MGSWVLNKFLFGILVEQIRHNRSGMTKISYTPIQMSKNEVKFEIFEKLDEVIKCKYVS